MPYIYIYIYMPYVASFDVRHETGPEQSSRPLDRGVLHHMARRVCLDRSVFRDGFPPEGAADSQRARKKEKANISLYLIRMS